MVSMSLIFLKGKFFILVGRPAEDVHPPVPVHASAAPGRDEKDPGLPPEVLQSPGGQDDYQRN